MQTHHIGSFIAKDKDGKEFTIHHYRDVVDLGTPENTRVGHAELGDLITSDGQNVNRLKKGKYEIDGVLTIEVTSDDPNAP